jgi:hypothetical protein
MKDIYNGPGASVIHIQREIKPANERNKEGSFVPMHATIDKEGKNNVTQKSMSNSANSERFKFCYDLNINHLDLLENIGVLGKTRANCFPNSIYSIEYVLSKETPELYKNFFAHGVNKNKDFSILIDEKEFGMLQNGVVKSTIKLTDREEIQALLSWYSL